MNFIIRFGISLLCCICFIANANYQQPSVALQQTVNQPHKISTRLSNDKQWLAVLTPQVYGNINELSQPELKLAGLRLSAQKLLPSRIKYKYQQVSLINLENNQTHSINPPLHSLITAVKFSPNSQTLSYIELAHDGAYIWLYDISTQTTTKISSKLNGTINLNYHWLPNSQGIISAIAIKQPPINHHQQTVPNIRETLAKKAPRRTYQDLLKNDHDAAKFEHISQSQLVSIDLQGKHTRLADSAINYRYRISPNGQYLLSTTLIKPFSYIVKYYDFPKQVTVIDLNNLNQYPVATLASGEFKEKEKDAVNKGPRNIHWRSDKPAQLAYNQALKKTKSSPFRDSLRLRTYPFVQSQSVIKTKWRISRTQWGTDDTALITEINRNKQQMRVSFFNSNTYQQPTLWYQRGLRDKYQTKGNLVTTKSAALGKQVQIQQNSLLHYGLGASPEGWQPFLKQTRLTTNKSQLLWQSASDKLETVRYVISQHPLKLIINQESPDTATQLVLVDSKGQRPLYQQAHDLSAYQGIKKQLVTYSRSDGTPLSGTLYLPADYTPQQGPLPVLMWAYPREYKDANIAAQINYSDKQYPRISPKGPVAHVANGYAVFDKVAMPIIGSEDNQPNDHFQQQLIANAQAAINTLVAMGVADRKRIAIGGHSYGAFMVANLLAHTDLFAAGIARSGAYNRSLTPFGFQSESRHFWQAPKLYQQISPFTHAHKINEPLLLIHGEMDSNSGTYPMQSQRLYSAIQGLGGQARLVMLPYESHSYKAKESIMHMLWEQENWLKQHLTATPSISQTQAAGTL